MNLEYNIHPSKKLNELYKFKNYQGADPEKAKFLFVGRDPNWHFNIEDSPIYNQIEDYLSDGVQYWKKHKIHHPFLAKGYSGDGRRYHKMFSKIDINSNHSQNISFVELIGFPTTGMAKKNNKKFTEHLLSDKNREHLIKLDKILNRKDKIAFVAWGLLSDFSILYKKLGIFENLAKIDKKQLNINDLNRVNNIYIHKHFSDSISNNTIRKISNAVKSELI